jgi:hypothetical protein
LFGVDVRDPVLISCDGEFVVGFWVVFFEEGELVDEEPEE